MKNYSYQMFHTVIICTKVINNFVGHNFVQGSGFFEGCNCPSSRFFLKKRLVCTGVVWDLGVGIAVHPTYLLTRSMCTGVGWELGGGG